MSPSCIFLCFYLNLTIVGRLLTEWRLMYRKTRLFAEQRRRWALLGAPQIYFRDSISMRLYALYKYMRSALVDLTVRNTSKKYFFEATPLMDVDYSLEKNDPRGDIQQWARVGMSDHSTLASGIVHSHFDVRDEIPQRQLLAWRDRVGHIIDVLPSRAQMQNPFSASIDRYAVGELAFTECRSDALLLERSVARISTDNIRDYVFHLFMEGGIASVSGRYTPRKTMGSMASVLALDMNQPVRMQRNACHMLTFFVPRATVEADFPEAETIHGRVFEHTTPLARLVIDHVASLNRDLPGMSAIDAGNALATGTQLLIAAFSKQAGLSGNARAAVRAAMFGKVRRYIQANLHEAKLSPEYLLSVSQLPRHTLYRMFEHEGGIEAYIRNCRLRAAADELVRFPKRPVIEIAYGLDFRSAQDFSRAFRRVYDMAPQDLRAQALRRVSKATVTDTDDGK